MTVHSLKQSAGHAPGIYFGMPADEYHADPSLSASGIKRLLISPLDFWVSSWMNPEYVEKETPAKALGKAYHKLILEGRGPFAAEYAVMPAKEDHPDALDGGEAIRAYCKEIGVKASGTIADMCERIREVDASVELWPEIKAEATAALGDRIPLTRAMWEELERAETVVSRMPSVKAAFTGGEPEVSIFWTDPSGVPMKARMDYLKPKTIVDLKSFANIMGKELQAAVANEIARNNYGVQAVTYCAGLNAIKALYAEQGAAIVHGEVDPKWLDETLTEKRTRFCFVFQQTGDVPNCIAREFAEYERYGGLGATRNGYWLAGEIARERGVRLYRQAMEHYGPDTPWIVDHGMKAFVDIDFPVWMLNASQEEAA